MAKLRSPNYPVISLRDAVAKVKPIWDAEHQGVVSKASIAQLMGYSSLNGTSLGVLSALTKYGLIETVGEGFRVSQVARDILIYPRGEVDRVHAVQKAAYLPALFNDLHNLSKDHLPGDHALQTYLLRKDFNPNSVASVIRVFRATIEYVNEETEGSEIEFNDNLEAEVSMHAQEPQRPRADSTPPRHVGIAPAPASTPEQNWGGLQLRFTLAPGTDVRADFRGDVTQEAIATFIDYLKIAQRTFPASPMVVATPVEQAATAIPPTDPNA